MQLQVAELFLGEQESKITREAIQVSPDLLVQARCAHDGDPQELTYVDENTFRRGWRTGDPSAQAV